MAALDDGFFWFPLHAGDFLCKTSGLSVEAVGAYVLLLVHLTRHSHLPGKMKEMQALCRGARPGDIRAALALLACDEVGFFSPEVKLFRQKAAANSKQKQEAGREGARARWAGKNQGRLKL